MSYSICYICYCSLDETTLACGVVIIQLLDTAALTYGSYGILAQDWGLSNLVIEDRASRVNNSIIPALTFGNLIPRELKISY
jgi:hypothetical protein